MKRILLLLAVVFFTGCSKEEAVPEITTNISSQLSSGSYAINGILYKIAKVTSKSSTSTSKYVGWESTVGSTCSISYITAGQKITIRYSKPSNGGSTSIISTSMSFAIPTQKAINFKGTNTWAIKGTFKGADVIEINATL